MRSERPRAPYSIPPRKLSRGLSSSLIAAAAVLVFCSGAPAAHARGQSAEAEREKETGTATYYSQRFEGRRTASGRTFRHADLIAAHPFHPFGTLVRVTNLRNGSFVDVRIADRGGFAKRSGNLIIDLSRAAASRLDMIAGGRAHVLVEVLGRGEQKIKAAAAEAAAPANDAGD